MIRQFETYEEEVVTILAEECAELIQEIMKMKRKGDYNSLDFVNEIGDIMALLDLAHQADMFSWSAVDERVQVKLEKLKTWSNHC